MGDPSGSDRRQSRLHNFSFPSLSWGSHRLLRCLKIQQQEHEEEQEEEDLDRIKDQMMAEFQKAPGSIPVPSSLEDEGLRPWNLRLRRAACNKPTGQSIGVDRPIKKSTPISRSPEENSSGSKEREKFSQMLSKREIEEDFLAMTGSKPPRRSKKRPRSVRKQIEVRKSFYSFDFLRFSVFSLIFYFGWR